MKVLMCGVPGMNKSDIDRLENFLKEHDSTIEFEFAGEDVLSDEEIIKALEGVDVLVSWDQEMNDYTYSNSNLRGYVAPSTGFNAANIEAASKNNVVVSNVSDYCENEVATHAVMLMLSLYKQSYKAISYVKDNNWDLSVFENIQRFENSIVGLLGFGSISQTVAKKLSGFGVEIIAYDPFVDQKDMDKHGVKKVELEELFKESDYLSLHTPLLESTKEIINKESLSKMKKNAYIINTARGALINHEDLYNALVEGRIKGAGLDVLGNEPPLEIDKKVIALENVIVTPHSAYLSEEASYEQIKNASINVCQILESKLPNDIRNKEIIPNLKWLKS